VIDDWPRFGQHDVDGGIGMLLAQCTQCGKKAAVGTVQLRALVHHDDG
jgi:hypothetical protein